MTKHCIFYFRFIEVIIYAIRDLGNFRLFNFSVSMFIFILIVIALVPLYYFLLLGI